MKSKDCSNPRYGISDNIADKDDQAEHCTTTPAACVATQKTRIYSRIIILKDVSDQGLETFAMP